MKRKPIYVKSRQMPKWPCPDCGTIIDGITGISETPEGTIPHVGGVTACAYCGRLLEIGEDGFVLSTLRVLLALQPYQKKVIESAIGKPIRVR